MKFSSVPFGVAALLLAASVSAHEERDITQSLNQGLWGIHDAAGQAMKDVASVGAKIKREPDITNSLNQGLWQIHDAAGDAMKTVASVGGKIKRTPDITQSLNNGLWGIHDAAGQAMKDVASVGAKIKRTPDITQSLNQGLWGIHDAAGQAMKDVATVGSKIKRTPDITQSLNQGLWGIHDAAGQAMKDVATVGSKIKRDVEETLDLRDLFSEGRAGLIVRGDDTEFHSRIARSCAPPPCGTPTGCAMWTPCLPTDSKGNFVREVHDVRAEFASALAVRESLAAGESTLMLRRDDEEAHILARCAPPPCGTPTGCAMWTPCLPTDSKGNFV